MSKRKRLTAREARVWDAAYATAFVAAGMEYHNAGRVGWGAETMREESAGCAELACVAAGAALDEWWRNHRE